MTTIIIKNRDEIVEQLTNLLKAFTVCPCDYQRDIYLYLDANGCAKLDVFVNPGGNSWRNDDHHTIYTDMGVGTDLFGDEVYDVFEDWGFADYAEVLGVSAEELMQKTAANSMWYDDDDEVSECAFLLDEFKRAVECYEEGFEEYYEKLCEYRKECIYDDPNGFFTDWAEGIIANFENE